MLKNRLRLVLLDRFGHHVKDVVHASGTKLKVVVRLDSLLRDRLRDALAITTLELTGEKIAEPIKYKSRQAPLQIPTYHLSRRGTIPRMKNSQTRHPGAQNPQPGPLPTGPVLKR